MFKRRPQLIDGLLRQWLRDEGLETPYLEYRAMQAWDEVVTELVAKNSVAEKIRNSIMYVRVTRPALRQNLSYTRTELVQAINTKVGAHVINDIKFC